MVKDRDIYNTYMRKYMLKRYHSRRQHAIAFLGGKCVRCGDTDNLQFDHVDKSKKTFPISELWSIAENKFFEELEKCQILCGRCHREKSLECGDYGGGHNKIDHPCGTAGRYGKGCRCELCKEAKRQSRKSKTIA